MIITHAISTEQLVQVLHSIALQQQTGRLSVEHVGAQGSEKGEIFFANGSTVFARTEQESGETALHRMVNWQGVQYAFFAGMQAPMAMETNNRGRFVRRPGNTRPRLPIELEETRQTPAVGMPAIPKSIRPPAMPLPAGVMPVHSNTKVLVSAMPAASAAHNLQPGIYAVFRALPTATLPWVMAALERRERIVFLLLDGRRTLRDVARLVHRDELDVARILVRLFKQGYIAYLGARYTTFGEKVQ